MAYVVMPRSQVGFDPMRADNWLSPGGFVLAAILAAGAFVGWRTLRKN